MEVKNGAEVIVTDQMWLDGMQRAEANLDENSVFTYSGSNNTIVVADQLWLSGEVIQDDETSELLVNADRFFPSAEIVWRDNDETFTIPFELEGISAEIEEGSSGNTIEITGPDYHVPGGTDYNPDLVFFQDAVCTPRLKKVTIEAVAGDHTVHLLDFYRSTPISGDSAGFLSARPYPDALYIVDLEVESGAKLVVDNSTLPPSDQPWNIYYTGDLNNNGDIVDVNDDPYTPVKLTTITDYGDFDGDKAANDTDDQTRFNDAYCTEVDVDANYDPLVDWNCDGIINDCDRDQYVGTWGSTGLDPETCTLNECS